MELALLRAAIDMARRRFNAALDQAEYARHLGNITPSLATAGPDVIAGEVYLRRGNLAGAGEAFRRTIQRWPADASALAGLAGLALHAGDGEAAADYALQALENNMQLPLAHYRLGVGLVYLERYPEAQIAFETFARLSPHRAGPYRWLTTIARRQSDGVKAASYRDHGRQIIRDRRASRAALNAE
jgi:tetratricopeptide (TPR) repeat protein